MEYKFEYVTEQDRQNLIDANSNKVIVEEQNLIEGNFLIFADEPRVYVQYITPEEQRIRDIEMAIAAIMGGAV